MGGGGARGSWVLAVIAGCWLWLLVAGPCCMFVGAGCWALRGGATVLPLWCQAEGVS